MILIIAAVVIGAPLVLLQAVLTIVMVVGIARPLVDARSQRELETVARVLLVDTPYESTPVNELPGLGFNGSAMNIDNPMYLDIEMPSEYAPVVAENIERAGWSVETPGCLTASERLDLPCGIHDEDGNHLGLASYWPGPDLTLLIGPR